MEYIVLNFTTKASQMSDKLLEMETFVRVVEAGSISAAADQLAVTKSVASRRLSGLESRLGAQLLVRTTRRLNLTDAGRAFLQQAKDILAAVDLAEPHIDARGRHFAQSVAHARTRLGT